MISVRFYIKPSAGSIHMTMKGHAQTAPKGEDLVCSAASILAYTATQAIQFMYKQDRLLKKPKIRIKDGDVTIIATPSEESYAEALHTFWVVQCGIHVLEHNYPDSVKLEHLKV